MMRTVLVLAYVATASAAANHLDNTKCTKLDITIKGGICDGTAVGAGAVCKESMDSTKLAAFYNELSVQLGDGMTKNQCLRMKTGNNILCGQVGGELKDICGTGADKTSFCKNYVSTLSAGVVACKTDSDCPGKDPAAPNAKKPCCSDVKAQLEAYCTKVDSKKYTTMVSNTLPFLTFLES